MMTSMAPIEVVWDMETGDPDDCLTLALLCGHPSVRLRAVTVTPGSAAQVGVVRAVLARLGVNVPVGAGDLDNRDDCVSQWYYDAFDSPPPSREAELASELLCRLCDGNTTLITGAPLKNLGMAIKRGGFTLGHWVAQGGFAGEGVVPPAWQLKKFRGLTTCPTWNFGAAARPALTALTCPTIRERLIVGKNVCHGLLYNRVLHERLAPDIAALPAGRQKTSLELIHSLLVERI